MKAMIHITDYARQYKNHFELLLTPNPLLPLRVKESLKDLLRFENRNGDIKKALDAAMGWLCAAQDVAADGGIPAFFSYIDGWSDTYPETSGYILSTFLDYYRLKNNDEYLQRADRIADWECTVANPDGSINGYMTNSGSGPQVFNTSQVVLGMCDICKELKKNNHIELLRKATDWITAIQETRGDWVRYTYDGLSHTYDSRTCWALLEAYKILNEKKLKDSAIKALDFYFLMQGKNGWYARSAFRREDPYLHAIAYTISGFLESGIILKEERYINSARKAADALLEIQRKNGTLAAQYNEGWQCGTHGDRYYPPFKYRCLTGEAQMSVIWAKLYSLTKEEKYKEAVIYANRLLMRTQIFCERDKRVHGGIKGSLPLYGEYVRYRIPNWAVKFFADALIAEEGLL